MCQTLHKVPEQPKQVSQETTVRTVGEKAAYVNRQLHESHAVSFLNTDTRNEEPLLRACFPRASLCAEPLTHMIA